MDQFMKSLIHCGFLLTTLACCNTSKKIESTPATTVEASQTPEEICKSSGKHWVDGACQKHSKEEEQCKLNGKIWTNNACMTDLEECHASHGVMSHGNCLSDLKTERDNDRKPLKATRMKNLQAPYDDEHAQAIFERGTLPRGARICLVGDTGNGSLAQKKVAAQMAQKCDQIRHLGDIIYYVGIRDIDDPKLKTRFFDIYNEMKVPMYITLGNHDYYQNADIWLDISKKYPEKYIFPNHYYLEFFSQTEEKGLCFLTLDSTPIHDLKGDLSNIPRVKTQFHWLESISDLMHKRCSYVMGFFHHPYVSVGEGRDDDEPPFYIDEFFEKRIFKTVNFLVNGHDHFLSYYPKLKRKGKEEFIEIPQIISGSGGMLQTAHRMSQRKFGKEFGKEFRETGFVQMTLLNSTDDANLEAKFVFYRFDGKVLTQFNHFLKKS